MRWRERRRVTSSRAYLGSTRSIQRVEPNYSMTGKAQAFGPASPKAPQNQLLPEIAPNGLGIRGAGQFRADRLGRSTIGRDSNQDVIERIAPHAIPVGFQRQVY